MRWSVRSTIPIERMNRLGCGWAALAYFRRAASTRQAGSGRTGKGALPRGDTGICFPQAAGGHGWTMVVRRVFRVLNAR